MKKFGEWVNENAGAEGMVNNKEQLKSFSVFKEPKNWNPKEDKFYKQVSRHYDEISWYESCQYDEILERFDWIKEFKGIEIHEYELDSETLFDYLPNESSKQLAKEFVRDYKIKELTK
jgi:hypothetical protein